MFWLEGWCMLSELYLTFHLNKLYIFKNIKGNPRLCYRFKSNFHILRSAADICTERLRSYFALIEYSPKATFHYYGVHETFCWLWWRKEISLANLSLDFCSELRLTKFCSCRQIIAVCNGEIPPSHTTGNCPDPDVYINNLKSWVYSSFSVSSFILCFYRTVHL